ncbi:prepilin peptidase [bacterium]|nr:prepilin peptidase [bacterium]
MDLSLNSYLLFWISVIGLCFGSFYNVVILRSLSNESIVFPASKCPQCGNKLKVWHNIPVFSYLFLRGKCAFCKKRISIQYPIIELITMFLFAFSFVKFGISYKTLLSIVLSSGLLIMTMTDLKSKLVDCNIAIGLAVVGFFYNWLVMSTPLDSFLGVLLGIVIFEVLAWSGYLFTKSRAFGEADTYVAAALGACFGVKGLLWVLVYTLVSAMIVIVPMFLYSQYKKNNKLTCVLFLMFLLSVLVFKFYFENFVTLAILAILGFVLAIDVLKKLKTEPSPTYLPLVPSFMLGALYYLFF